MGISEKMKKTSRKPKKNTLCRKGMRAQSVIFSKDYWTKESARKWLLEHAMKTPVAKEEGKYLHYQQEPTSHFEKGSFRTKTIDVRRGVRLIVGCPKTSAPRTVRRINPGTNIPSTVVQLGKAVEISLMDDTVLKLRGYLLLSNPEGTKLYCLKGGSRKTARPKEGKTIDKARSLYSRFTDFDSEKSFSLQAATDKMMKIGQADHIVYSSDKWTGRSVEYIHEFNKPPDIWANRDRSVIALIGAIRVKREGITG